MAMTTAQRRLARGLKRFLGGHRRARPPHLFACVVLLGALWAGATFVFPKAKGGCTSRAVLPHVQVVRGISRHPTAAVGAELRARAQASPWPYLGCALLLWVCGSPASRSHHERRISSCNVVPFNAVGQLRVASYSNPLNHTPHQPSGATVPLPVMPSALLEVATVQLPASAQMQAMREGMEQHGISQSKITAIPTLFARSALFVGGMRHKWGRPTPAQSVLAKTMRAACRHIGAHLLSAQRRDVPQASYDPSRVRTQLQVGLHVKQHELAERPREARTASSTSRLKDQFGELFAAYFDMSGQHQDD